jgi:cell division septal protein FtsQ
VLLLAALAGGIAFASTDAKFFVYDAQIVGARHLAPETIYEMAGIDEQNILWVQPRDVAQRLVQVDGIKAVRVSCSLPAEVVIEIEEREPVVMWRALMQDQDWWLDEEGVVLPYHGNVDAADTIFVVDSSQRILRVGEPIKPEGIVQSVQRLAAALPATKVYAYDADRGLSFVHKVGAGEWPVYVGSSDDLARKIQVVQVLTDYLTEQNIRPRYVDVRWPDHPVFGKPPSEEVPGE